MKIETRCVTERPELRATADAKRIAGYGAVFNVETVIGDWWRELIVPGAFANVLKDDVRSLFNHDENIVLGRSVAGSLSLREDEKGLFYEVTINPADPEAVGVAARVERGDVTGSSIGFRVKREEWIRPETPDQLPLRRVLEYDLLRDVGPVTFPAFEDTTAEARDAAAAARSVMPAAVTQAGADIAVFEQLLALDALEAGV